jgi:predicted nucleic acid-binding protein
LVAYINANDADHESAAHLLDDYPGELRVPELVIAEATYILNTRMGIDTEVLFLRDLAAGNFTVEPLAPTDWQRIADLVDRYRNLRGDDLSEGEHEGMYRATGLGTVDASVVATAERLTIREIATLDNDFRIVRPTRWDYFTILPE